MADGKTASKPKKASTRPDIATLGGLLLAAGGILGGLVLEGGKLTDIAQVTALMIVLGGTLGAVMVTTPLSTLIRATKCLGAVFFEHAQAPAEVIEEIIGYATKARKNSIISLEADLPNIADPFLQKAISLSVDGTDLQELRKMMELDIAMEHRGGDLEAHGHVDIMHNMTEGDAKRLRTLIERHVAHTGSPRGQEILADWANYRGKFVKVMPTEYRRALMAQLSRPLISVGA